MAIIFECGFEAGLKAYYTAQGWTFYTSATVSNTLSHKTLTGMGGDWAFYGIGYLYSPTLTGVPRWLHFWVYPPLGDTESGEFNVGFYQGTTLQVQVRFIYGGGVQLFRGTTWLALGGPYDTQVPHWIAIEALCQDAGGRLTVFVDGVQIAQFLGDTKSHATLTGWNQFRFTDLSGHNHYFDDIVITDGALERLNEHFVLDVLPDGDSAPLELTPSTPGSHYLMVDDVPASTTDYCEATAVNMEDNYTTTSLTWTPDAISFVAIWSYAARDGVITSAKNILTTAVQTKSASHTLGAIGVYTPIIDIWLTDPADALPWTDTKVNSMGIGIEFVA